jgi:dephospho-CoA kinase
MLPLFFGLTGGIACGKTTVAGFLKERGVGIVDADQVAREIVAPGTEGLAAIAKAFGPAVLAADGTLDRKALGAIIFHDPAARALLNQITHPLIRTASTNKARAMTGFALIAYEAALIVETGQADAFRPLVVVIANESLQLARLTARDGLSEVEARARLSAQMSLADKAAAADHVIDTSCSLDELRSRTDDVWRKLTA